LARTENDNSHFTAKEINIGNVENKTWLTTKLLQLKIMSIAGSQESPLQQVRFLFCFFNNFLGTLGIKLWRFFLFSPYLVLEVQSRRFYPFKLLK
jgi:hypothetical protein